MNPRSLLSTYKIPNKATIYVICIGVECSICSTRYPGKEKNVPITNRCKHERATCASCLRTWIQSQLETVGWDKISCPECNQTLEHHDVRTHAGKTVLEKYQHVASRAALSAIPGFQFCLNPAGCDSGQIHASGQAPPLFACIACGYKLCVICSRAWRSEETCEQFTARTTTATRNERASERFVEANTKECS